jgi:hypothetical protein
MKAPLHNIHIHPAPVLALWATVVAERLGYNHDTALTLGHALANLDEAPSDAARKGVTAIELLGRQVPVVEVREGMRGLVKEAPCSPAFAERYVKNMFGDKLEIVREAMERLSRAHSPSDLMQNGFKIYEAFRPQVPARHQGDAREEVLDLNRLRALARLAER